jgi:lysophospholipase L1-like esterase
MSKSSLRNWLARGVVFSFSILFALALLEGAVRILHLGSGGFWEPYSLYGWRNIPNAKGWESCYGECQVYVEINSQGLRDNDIPYEKPPGTQRVFLLGDSITAAMQVPLDETFGKISEQALNEHAGEDTWQVINGGVNGFGTDNELLFYRLEAKKYQPDVVVLAIYLANDVYNNSYELEVSLGGNGHKPYFSLDDSGQLVLHNYPVEDTSSLSIKIGTFLKKHFQLPRFVAQVLQLRRNVPAALQPLVELVSGQRGAQQLQERGQEATSSDSGGERPAQGGRRANICAQEYAPQVEEAWAITKALLLHLRTEVEAEGARLVVLAIPAAPQIFLPAEGNDWYCDRPNDELDNFLTEADISSLDLLDEFRQHALDGGEPLYYETDFHLNSNGHRLAGELLGDYLNELEGQSE